MLHTWPLQHFVSDAFGIWKLGHGRVPFGRAQPRREHEKINVGRAKLSAKHPLIIADLIVDHRPGFS